MKNILVLFCITIATFSCSKKEKIYESYNKLDYKKTLNLIYSSYNNNLHELEMDKDIFTIYQELKVLEATLNPIISSPIIDSIATNQTKRNKLEKLLKPFYMRKGLEIYMTLYPESIFWEVAFKNWLDTYKSDLKEMMKMNGMNFLPNTLAGIKFLITELNELSKIIDCEKILTQSEILNDRNSKLEKIRNSLVGIQNEKLNHSSSNFYNYLNSLRDTILGFVRLENDSILQNVIENNMLFHAFPNQICKNKNSKVKNIIKQKRDTIIEQIINPPLSTSYLSDQLAKEIVNNYCDSICGSYFQPIYLDLFKIIKKYDSKIKKDIYLWASERQLNKFLKGSISQKDLFSGIEGERINDITHCVCLDIKNTVIEECKYLGGLSTTRYKTSATFIIKDIKSGETIAKKKFNSDYPKPCEDTKSVTYYNGNPVSKTIEAGKLDEIEIREWLYKKVINN